MKIKRVFKIFRNLVRNLDWEATKVFLSHPFFGPPTVWATIESIMIAEENFEDDPDKNGPANAYRHALWNLLIVHYCSKISNREKALKWAKEITDLHEKLFPNKDFDREMDLHNNTVGRQLYLDTITIGSRKKKDFISRLNQKSETAIALTDEKEFVNYTGELVYFPPELRALKKNDRKNKL